MEQVEYIVGRCTQCGGHLLYSKTSNLNSIIKCKVCRKSMSGLLVDYYYKENGEYPNLEQLQNHFYKNVSKYDNEKRDELDEELAIIDPYYNRPAGGDVEE